MTIQFFLTRETYGGFSNFSRHKVDVYGLTWPTSEHAFQAMKFAPHRPDLIKAVQATATPKLAAAMGRDRSLPLAAGWEQAPQLLPYRIPDHVELQVDDGLKHEEPLFNRLKDVLMYEVVYAKMTQHAELRSLLLQTSSEPIAEASPRDSYWGWGKDEKGENKMGRILMAIRGALVRGAATKTAFGKPDRVGFTCTAEYPWRPEYGQATHPDTTSEGRWRGDKLLECTHCGHLFEGPV
jgi:hypothetical protein